MGGKKNGRAGEEEEVSQTFKVTHSLASWARGQQQTTSVVDAIKEKTDQKKAHARNSNFLAKLREAEERDEARASVAEEPRGAADEAAAAPPPAAAKPKLLGAAFAGASVPLMRKRPGEDTHREIEAAQREARLRERESAAAARRLQQPARKLSVDEFKVAAELFWAFDSDASATIDRGEWTRLMNEVARRTGRPPVSAAEAAAAFESADADGNGELDLVTSHGLQPEHVWRACSD